MTKKHEEAQPPMQTLLEVHQERVTNPKYVCIGGQKRQELTELFWVLRVRGVTIGYSPCSVHRSSYTVWTISSSTPVLLCTLKNKLKTVSNHSKHSKLSCGEHKTIFPECATNLISALTEQTIKDTFNLQKDGNPISLELELALFFGMFVSFLL